MRHPVESAVHCNVHDVTLLHHVLVCCSALAAGAGAGAPAAAAQAWCSRGRNLRRTHCFRNGAIQHHVDAVSLAISLSEAPV